MMNFVYKTTHWLNRNTGFILLISFVFFATAMIGFQKDNRKLLQDTKHITQDTQVIVSKQDETLVAIRDLSLDNKLTSKQLGDTIICMLLVPVSQRTTQTQDDCRNQAITRTPASKTNGSTPSQPSPQSSSTPSTSQPSAPASEKPSTARRLLDNLHDVTDNVPLLRSLL